MAIIFSKLFGSQKKDFTYTGPRPPSSLSSVQGGPEYYKTITDRLARRGVGYGPEYIGQANPQIQNLRGTFQSYTLPELESELSRTGRRRGTSGFQQVEQAYRNQALNENDIVARLAQRQSEAEREDVNTAFSSLGNYANNEADLQNRAANFEYSNIYKPQVDREQERMAKEAEGYQKYLDRGLDAAGGFISAGGLSGFGKPMYNTLGGGGNPNIGFGRSGNSMNQRLLKRYANAGRVY